MGSHCRLSDIVHQVGRTERNQFFLHHFTDRDALIDQSSCRVGIIGSSHYDSAFLPSRLPDGICQFCVAGKYQHINAQFQQRALSFFPVPGKRNITGLDQLPEGFGLCGCNPYFPAHRPAQVAAFFHLSVKNSYHPINGNTYRRQVRHFKFIEISSG